MTTIHKFSIPLDKLTDVVELDMPRGAHVLSAGNQNDALCFWAVVDTQQQFMENRRFRVAGTGHPLGGADGARIGTFQRGRFLGTVQFLNGRLVFHIFDESRDESAKLA